LQKAFSRERSVAGSDAIHVIEKDGNTGLPRHFVPRNYMDFFFTLFLARIPIIVEVLI